MPPPIVAVGASAGGLHALSDFLEPFPTDSGMALVVVTHLNPSQASSLPRILSGHTSMPVLPIENGMLVEADTVYVVTPGQAVEIRGDFLRLEPLTPESRLRPFDGFLKSLAVNSGPHAVAVVLSGMGSDGAAGATAVKSVGGMVLVQEDPDYAGMPSHAQQAVTPDAVIPAEAMAARIVNDFRTKRSTQHSKDIIKTLQDDPVLTARILDAVRARVGQDFSEYRTSTIHRRIVKRMGTVGQEEPEAYATLVEGNAREAEALAKDLLVSVTKFLRDPEAFDLFRTKLFPELVRTHTQDDPIRIWCAGCSTGEEAYTLGMLALEAIAAAGTPRQLQLFATDSDAEAIEFARRGLYTPEVVRGLPADLLELYFAPAGKAYSVSPRLREPIVFAVHDLLKDPPFIRMDLITCRNLLIYLEQHVQRKALGLFTEALRPGGGLFLGPSEGLSGFETYYTVVDARWKIYQRNAVEYVRHAGAQRFSPRIGSLFAAPPAKACKHSEPPTLQRRLLARYAPPAVLVDEDDKIRSINGDTDPFFSLAAGEATHDIHLCARPYLRPRLRVAMANARAQAEDVLLLNIHDPDKDAPPFNLRVSPVASSEETVDAQSVRELLVAFEPAGTQETTREDNGEELGLKELVALLENQLRLTGEQLQENQEWTDKASQELRASNEELISMNEELQSANEEMESSHEELQAMNEEMFTLNAELQLKVAELGELNADMENLFSSTEIATIFLDHDLVIKRFTPRASDVFYLREGDKGRPLAELGSVLERPTDLLEVCRQVLKDYQQVELEAATQDGRAFLSRVLPYIGIDGEVQGAVLTFVDITSRKTMVEELRRHKEELEELVEERSREVRLTKEKFEAVFRASPAAMILQDLETGERLGVNRAFEDMLGCALGEHEDWRAHWEDAEQFDALLAQARREGRFDNHRAFIHACDGSRMVAMLSGEVITLEGRNILVSAGLDITERDRLKTELAEREARLRLTFEQSAHGMVFVSDDGRPEHFNEAFRALLGYPAETLRAMRFPEFTHPDDVEADLEQYGKLVEGEIDSYRMEKRYLRADGAVIWTDLTVSRIAQEDKKLAFFALVKDITDRKRLEEHLQTARKEAERATRAKSEFLANMSHELRTPIAGIMGAAEVLRLNAISREQEETLTLLEYSAQVLLQTLNDILDLSKIVAKGVELHPEDFNLRECVRKTVALYAHQAREKGIALEVSVADGVPSHVHGDEHRLCQVLRNLVSNAVKFTASGQVTVFVRTREEASTHTEGVPLEIAVSDTGPGVPDNKKDALFQEFSQLDSSYAKQFGGTGLGLAICKKLMEVMGGVIDVSSRPGEGSTFSLRLTLPTAATQPDALPEGSAPATVPPMNILLAEDNPINQFFLETILHADGHTVVKAANGQEALDQLREGDFDVVLMDIQMPVMDGLETTRRIRSGEAPGVPADIPVVALTAYAMEEDREKFMDAGMNHYVSKPFTTSDIRRALQRVRPVGAVEPVGPGASIEPGVETPAQSLLNMNTVDELRSEHMDVLPSLLAHFKRESGRGLEAARASVREGELCRAGDMVHFMASSAGALGMTALHEACLVLERELRAGNATVESLTDSLAELTRLFRASVAALEHALDS